MSPGFDLAVDFGTSNTVAALRGPNGQLQSVIFDGSPLLPSAVCLEPSGRLLVGRDGLAGARMYPEAAELTPKRCIDDSEILLGGRAVPVEVVIGAILARVVAEVRRITGTDISRAVLTYPAAWGARRKAMLAAAAVRAGLRQPTLVPEPIAAAAHFVLSPATQVPVGGPVMVYDFGGGTFDASVVRRTRDGIEVLSSAGLADAGGLDVDASVVAALGATYAGRDPDGWRRLEEPRAAADHRARRQLWDDVRAAKEMLSRASSAVVHLPTLGVDAPVGREQLERLARPVLDRTVACARATLLEAGVAPGDLGGLLLVGGSSRIPLVATLLHRALGIAPVTFDQPELVVAQGALVAGIGPAVAGVALSGASPAATSPSGVGQAGVGPTGVGQTGPHPGPVPLSSPPGPPVPPPAPARKPILTPRRAVVAGALVALLGLIGTVAVLVGPEVAKRFGRPADTSTGVFRSEKLAAAGSPGATASATPGGTAMPSAAATASAGPGSVVPKPTAARPPTPARTTATGTQPMERGPEPGEAGCTGYTSIALTKTSGPSVPTATLKVRACVYSSGDSHGVDWNYLRPAGSTLRFSADAELLSCEGSVVHDFGTSTGTIPAANTSGQGASQSTTSGVAMSYQGRIALSGMSITDKYGAKWSASNKTLVTPCL